MNVEFLTRTRNRHLKLMQKTIDTYGHVLKDLTPEQAVAYTDGPEGWSVVEVLCHVRDFNEIFLQRAQLMAAHDQPALQAYDHEALVVERDYKSQDFRAVYADLRAKREEAIRFFEALTPEQWERVGIHPEVGPITLMDSMIQVGHHDADHLEQLTRIITQIPR
ncbi:MAG: DinB family protein [Anaerolineae bacterium]|jgi:uncharacterized damage-inducible protein DinB|nr:DinB family protein [Anaerolineae bacterium]